MGKLQITTAEIKTRILRVCHVKITRIYTVSHVKNPAYVCHVPYTLARTLATELPAIVATRSAAESWTDKEGCTTLLYTVSCAASPTRRSLLTETANSELLLMVAAVLHVVSSSWAGRTALF